MTNIVLKTKHKAKEGFSDHHFHKIPRLFNVLFLSPQVKRKAIITYKRRTYEFSHELQNEFGLGYSEIRKD